jgi:arginine deiminase
MLFQRDVTNRVRGKARERPEHRPGVSKMRVIETGEDSFQAEREQWDDGNNVVALEPGIVFDQAENSPPHYQGDHRRLARIRIVAAPQAVREIWSCLAPGHDRQREAGCPQVVLACS